MHSSLRTFLTIGLCCSIDAGMRAAEPNTLTSEEKAAGWKLIFDGQTFNPRPQHNEGRRFLAD